MFTSLGGLSQDSLLHISALCVRHKTWTGLKKPNVSTISGPGVQSGSSSAGVNSIGNTEEFLKRQKARMIYLSWGF